MTTSPGRPLLKHFPLRPGAVLQVAREVKAAAEDVRPLVVAGAPGPARELAGRLGEGGDPDAVRDLSGRSPSAYDLEGAGVLVYVIAGEAASAEDERALRLADRKGVGVVALLLRPRAGVGPVDVPYVLATDVVETRPGEELPAALVAERVADRAGEKSYALAAKLPVLRQAACEEIVRRFSRQNGILGAAVFIPGADLPALTLNQLRMVLRIAAAYGERVDLERAVELVAVVGAGFGFRALARELLGFVPGAGWAVKGAVAYAGTRALGEAAIAYFEAGAPVSALTRMRAVRSWS